MHRLAAVLVVTGVLSSGLTLRAGLASGPPSAPPASHSTPRPAPAHAPDFAAFIDKYCLECHDEKPKKNELRLAAFDVAKADEHAEIAEKMVRKLRTGHDAAEDARAQPDAATRLALVTALETTLDAAAAAQAESRPAVVPAAESRRVRRGGQVALRPRHRRQHVSARRHDQRELRQHRRRADAVGHGDAGLHARGGVRQPRRRRRSLRSTRRSTQYEVPRTQSQKDRVEGAPFGTRGGTVVTHNFPADGKYKFQLLLHGEPAGLLFGRTVRDIQMEVAIDGERAALLKVDRWISESDPDGLTVSTPPIQVRAGARTRRRDVHPGVRGLGRRSDQADRSHAGRHADRRRLRRDDAAAPAQSGDRRARSRSTGVSDNPTRRAIFICRPTAPEEAAPCARRIVERLGDAGVSPPGDGGATSTS